MSPARKASKRAASQTRRSPGGGQFERLLDVSLADRQVPLHVGRLAQHGHDILFEYDSAFLSTGLELSPLGLPLRPGIQQEQTRVFGGLHGVFADSLPDGWGLRLMDREFTSRGIEPTTLRPLDRLHFVGARAMGALVYKPAVDLERKDSALDLEDLAAQAERLYEGSPEDVLPELLEAGGSPAGARPKVLVAYHPATHAMRSGAEEAPAGFEHYLVKFPTREEGEDIGAVEMVYAEMARAAGIEIPITKLFSTRGGRRCFGVQRFDRVATILPGPAHQRRHIHTLGGLLHASHREFGCTYREYLRTAAALTKDRRSVFEALRRMVFNVLACNRDDHVKNFAFLMRPDGTWHLSPAYDLVYSSGPGGEHSMMIGTEGARPTYDNFRQVADPEGIAPAELQELVTTVVDAVDQWPRLAATYEVFPETRTRIADALRRARSDALTGRPVTLPAAGRARTAPPPPTVRPLDRSAAANTHPRRRRDGSSGDTAVNEEPIASDTTISPRRVAKRSTKRRNETAEPPTSTPAPVSPLRRRRQD